MPSYQDAFYLLKKELESLYDPHEANAISHELMEHITGLNKLQRLAEKNTVLTKSEETQLTAAIKKALKGTPLQYITGQQWFMGNVFQVNKHVLIPRPETEELVQWIVEEWRGREKIRILDIGTGSGCIPISLKLELPGAQVSGIDISAEALKLAQKNADALKAEVQFLEADFLNMNNWLQLGLYDVIVSNPPYIPAAEKEGMDKNVRDFEPGAALFVPDDNPLLFYRKIAIFAAAHLRGHGSVYCETHRDYASESLELFEEMGFASLELRKDMHGNERMIKAGAPGQP